MICGVATLILGLALQDSQDRVRELEERVRRLEREIGELRSEVARLSGPRVTMSVRDASVHAVVDMLSRISGHQIGLPAGIDGAITFSVNDVSWFVVLETMIRTCGDWRIEWGSAGVVRVRRPRREY